MRLFILQRNINYMTYSYIIKSTFKMQITRPDHILYRPNLILKMDRTGPFVLRDRTGPDHFFFLD